MFHPSFRFAGVPRRELGLRTVFNVLGPLCNPAGAQYQALGVADGAMAAKMADVLLRLGVKRAIVFHASDGMDELSVASPSYVIEIDGGRKEYELDPAELSPRIEITNAGELAARKSDLVLPPTDATNLDVGGATLVNGHIVQSPLSSQSR